MKRNVVLGLVVASSGAAVYAGLIAVVPPIMHAFTLAAASDVPTAINHQGMVAVNGVRFTGSGQFKFAIVDPDAGNNVWTNDGSNLGGTGTPTNAVTLTATDGIYSVRLGSSPMTSISSSLFADGNLKLRIWFNDGTNGWQQLSPDHELTSTPYAMTTADSAVNTSKLADDAVTAAKIADGAVSSGKLASDVAIVPVGSLIATARSTAPSGWLLCNGAAVSRTTYADLFAAVGTTYGAGDGSTTFNLPDMRGRVLMGSGQGVGSGSSGTGTPAGSNLTNRPLAGWGGEETHQLTVAEMPAHSHNNTELFHDYNGAGGSWTYVAKNTSTAVANPFQTASVGGGGAHNIVQPFQTVNWIIKY